jgi:hypothetical protein
MYCMIFRRRSAMEVKILRAITSRSILANQRSTWLSQDEAVMGRAGHFGRPFAQFTTSVIGTTSAR